MKIQLHRLTVYAKESIERVDFSELVTFLYGPVSTGKSTVARLIDYCLGGNLERTPAIQQEFVSATLSLTLDKYDCTLERAADDTSSVRVTWSGPDNDFGSVLAPISGHGPPLLGDNVYNLSDLIFYLCGVTPIKVRQRSRDPDSPLVRLSIRDIWWYCYLDQTELDSSFFHLGEPFRGRKSQDVMRFFTGLHSERLSQLDDELMSTLDSQRSKREAVVQIRSFMEQFHLGSGVDLADQLQTARQELTEAQRQLAEIEQTRSAQIHPTDDLRTQLRHLSVEVEEFQEAVLDSREVIAEQTALRAELITAKTKAERTNQAEGILKEVHYQRCPECGTDISSRPETQDHCRLCGSEQADGSNATSPEREALRLDLNERIDQISDSIMRREQALARLERQLTQAQHRKGLLDQRLQEDLARYDSLFLASIRNIEREIATLEERIRSLEQLQRMPEAINALEEEAGALQGTIDVLRSEISQERERLGSADANIAAIAEEFKRIMISVSFPGVSEEDEVDIDPRNWKPLVVHGDQEWNFWDAGSGGKKTLFNVCYALAIHAVALDRDMPVPNLLIIDSPTKNISEDENPELVRALYDEIYRLAHRHDNHTLQFLLIDSDLVSPRSPFSEFSVRRMAGEPDAPSLISYYRGP